MTHTTITDLAHAPIQIILAAIQEDQARSNSIFNSPLAIRTPEWGNRALSEGGVQIEIPVLSPLPGGYTLQNPGTPPTVDKLTSLKQIAPVTYREKAWGRDSFSFAKSGIDIISLVARQINTVRFDGMETALTSILTGIFKSTPFASLRITTPNEAPVGSPGSNVPWTTDIFHDTIGIMGLKESELVGGVILMHPKLRTYLKKQDELDYVRASDGTINMETYKGLRLVVDDRCIRAGTTSGFVYPFYVCAPGTVVVSLATQGTDGTTASSLAMDSDVPNLKKALYDRITYVLHVNGVIWTPATASLTIAAGGPTDVQLATAQAWACAYAAPKEIRIVSGEVNI